MGASQDEREEFHLSKPQDYFYLNQVPLIITPPSRGGSSELLLNTPQLILSDRGKNQGWVLNGNKTLRLETSYQVDVRSQIMVKKSSKKSVWSPKTIKDTFLLCLHHLQFQDDKQKEKKVFQFFLKYPSQKWVSWSVFQLNRMFIMKLHDQEVP